MTEFVDVPGGRIAFEVTGSGPLVVLSPGIGVCRQDYRFLAPVLAQAGYRGGRRGPARARRVQHGLGGYSPAPTSRATWPR